MPLLSRLTTSVINRKTTSTNFKNRYRLRQRIPKILKQTKIREHDERMK